MMEVGGQKERSAIISNRSLQCGSCIQKTLKSLGRRIGWRRSLGSTVCVCVHKCFICRSRVQVVMLEEFLEDAFTNS